MGKLGLILTVIFLGTTVLTYQNCSRFQTQRLDQQSTKSNDAYPQSASVSPNLYLQQALSKTEIGGVGVLSSSSQSINLQDYFPKTYKKNAFTKYQANSDGSAAYEFTFFPATPEMMKIYDSYLSIGTPGQLLVWQKSVKGSAGSAPTQPDGKCILTNGLLWMGNDKSVTEVGDWFATDHCNPSVAFGYQDFNTGQTSGLLWSGPEALSTKGSTSVVRPRIQSSPGGPLNTSSWMAYSYSALLDVLPTFTPEYGRDASGRWVRGAGKTYKNVAKFVFWHGVRDINDPSFSPPKCPTDPLNPMSSYYLPVPGFKSYASLYYMAPGEGFIEMDFLFNETDNYFPPEMTCKGLALSSASATAKDIWNYGPTWVDYVDPLLSANLAPPVQSPPLPAPTPPPTQTPPASNTGTSSGTSSSGASTSSAYTGNSFARPVTSTGSPKWTLSVIPINGPSGTTIWVDSILGAPPGAVASWSLDRYSDFTGGTNPYTVTNGVLTIIDRSGNYTWSGSQLKCASTYPCFYVFTVSVAGAGSHSVQVNVGGP